jgi:CIC family chloride channel protein
MIRRVSILTLLGIVIGGVVGVLAVGFVEAVLWLNDLFYVSPQSRKSVSNQGWLVAMTIGIPTAGGLIVGLLSLMMPANRFHDPSDAIRTVHNPDAAMPAKNGVLSTLAACVSLGSGASVGQYGPLAHMGASLGSWISRLTYGDRSLGPIGIACGVAAAIAAAFHAPIAGLIFAREVILRHYSLRAFAPIAVSATLGYVVAHVVFDRAPLFRVDELVVASPYEYLVFIAIGITGAVVATVFMRAVEFAGTVCRNLTWPVPVKTALAGLALGVVALQMPDILGIGQEALRLAMSGDAFSAAELAQTMLAKLFLTALCLGFGFAGGVFSPALLIGTLFGALVGSGAAWIFGEQQSPIAVYAVCGMVAVTSPVIGAPLTAVLIVFELTQNFDLATAAMVSVAFANLIGFRIYGRSFFDVQLQARGFDLSLGRDKVTAQQRTIGGLLHQDYTKGREDHTLTDIRAALIRDRRSEAYIVDSSGSYVGTLTLHRLMELIAAGTELNRHAGPYAKAESLILSTDTSIWTAMSKMEDFVGESIPVLHDGRLVGVLFESTIVSAYLGLLEDIRREENAAV